MDKVELALIATELLALRERAKAAGSRGTAFMIVAAARQAEIDAGVSPLADAMLDEMISAEPIESARRYDIDGG